MAFSNVPMDKDNQGLDPPAKSKLKSLTSTPSPVIDSNNQGGSNFGSTTSLVASVGAQMDSSNRGSQPTRKVGTGA
jgi:hypothetical protein